MEKNGFSKQSSLTVSALRFPLMVGIVFIHFNVLDGIEVEGMLRGADLPSWLKAINIVLSKVVPTVGVPLFFLFSGYFFARSGLTARSYREKLRRRARTLLVPYVAWNLIAIIYALAFHPEMRAEWSPWRFLACFWDDRYGLFGHGFEGAQAFMNPVNAPLWYVRDLMIIMIFSPVLHWAVRRAGWLFVALLGAAWVALAGYPLGHVSYLLAALLFFTWGMCYAAKGIDFVESMGRFSVAPWIWLVLIVTDAVMRQRGCFGRNEMHCACIVVGMFAAVSIASRLVGSRRNGSGKDGSISSDNIVKFLSDSSFFLLAFHLIIMGDVAAAVVGAWFVDSPVYMAALYFLVPTLTILACLALYWLMRRFAPRLCALLTGGR